jgi:hypothetical protein
VGGAHGPLMPTVVAFFFSFRSTQTGAPMNCEHAENNGSVVSPFSLIIGFVSQHPPPHFPLPTD